MSSIHTQPQPQAFHPMSTEHAATTNIYSAGKPNVFHTFYPNQQPPLFQQHNARFAQEQFQPRQSFNNQYAQPHQQPQFFHQQNFRFPQNPIQQNLQPNQQPFYTPHFQQYNIPPQNVHNQRVPPNIAAGFQPNMQQYNSQNNLLSDSGTMHPSLYTKNQEIIWAQVNQDMPLQAYPMITVEVLKKEFPSLANFLDNNQIQIYTLRDIKQQSLRQANNPTKLPTNQRFQENLRLATLDKNVPECIDNRMDKLHPITFTHAPLKPAKDILDERRKMNLDIKPINAYDLSHIKWSGKLADEHWEMLHDLSNKKLKLKFFFQKDQISSEIDKALKISRHDNKSLSITEETTLDSFDSVAQTKTALKVLIECQQSIFPLNKSAAILDYFITQKGDFAHDVEIKIGKSDLAQDS